MGTRRQGRATDAPGQRLGGLFLFAAGSFDAGHGTVLIVELQFPFFDEPNGGKVIDGEAAATIHALPNQNRLFRRSILGAEGRQSSLNLISNGIEQVQVMHAVESSGSGVRV